MVMQRNNCWAQKDSTGSPLICGFDDIENCHEKKPLTVVIRGGSVCRAGGDDRVDQHRRRGMVDDSLGVLFFPAGDHPCCEGEDDELELLDLWRGAYFGDGLLVCVWEEAF
jgi:hypothetical protein